MDVELMGKSNRVPNRNGKAAPELSVELLGLFDLMNVGLVVLDRQHRVVYSSAPGEAVMEDSDEISLLDDRFRLARQNCQQWLDDMLAKSPRDMESGRVAGNLFLRGGRGETPLLLSVLPLAHVDLFALMIIEPRHAAEAAVEAASLYRFTNAEKRLLGELCLGRSLTEIGDESTRSSNTLRSQLRSMFRKTGTKRQGELIARMLQLGLVRQRMPNEDC
ncbi:MAG: helix-turn-helix transcriptional regulator [Gammaproteobacteria bacterium]|nr:helix-turn-helix transcriptional regulator [Gammaproteobacteria bacterium]